MYCFPIPNILVLIAKILESIHVPITRFLIRATLACDCGSDVKTPCGSTWGWSLSIIYSLSYTAFLITFQGFFPKVRYHLPQNIDLTPNEGVTSPDKPCFHLFHRSPLDETAYLHPVTKPPRRWPQMADRGQPARIWCFGFYSVGYVSLAHLHIILVMYPPIGLNVNLGSPPPPHLPLVCTLSEVRNDFRSKCIR